MNINDDVKKIISEHFHSEVTAVKSIGKGASGQVFRISLNSAPYTVAVKLSEHYDLIKEEKDMLDYLRPRVSYRVPETYFICSYNSTAILAMEFIDGISGNSKKMLLLSKKKHLAENIIDTLINTQKASYNKFGTYKNPRYNTWKEYYSEFFADIYDFSNKKYTDGQLSKTVIDALGLIKDNFDIIFSEEIKTSYLCHGDFWMCNMIIDFRKCELSGVIDPFNVIWAEPEYELFALTVGYGKIFRLFELYKSRCDVSEYCDIKVELYALCNELHWYKELGSIGHDYLDFRANNLIKLLDKH